MTDARSAGADPGAHGDGLPVARGQEQWTTGGRSARPRPAGQPHRGHESARHPVTAYFRANPQVLALLVICIVLGLGTFLAVLFGLLTAGSDQTTGEPSGAILGAHGVLAAMRSALP